MLRHFQTTNGRNLDISQAPPSRIEVKSWIKERIYVGAEAHDHEVFKSGFSAGVFLS